MSPSHKTRKQTGNEGEDLALKYLKAKGFRLHERNFVVRGGEIDLVMEKDNCLHFVEVKLRSSTKYGDGLESIDDYKVMRLSRAAEYYLIRHPEFTKKDKCFSVLNIKFAHSKPEIEFFSNAFEAL